MSGLPNMLYYTNTHGVDFTQRIDLTPKELTKLINRLKTLETDGRLKGWGVGLSPTLDFSQAMDVVDREATDPMPSPAS